MGKPFGYESMILPIRSNPRWDPDFMACTLTDLYETLEKMALSRRKRDQQVMTLFTIKDRITITITKEPMGAEHERTRAQPTED